MTRMLHYNPTIARGVRFESLRNRYVRENYAFFLFLIIHNKSANVLKGNVNNPANLKYNLRMTHSQKHDITWMFLNDFRIFLFEMSVSERK